MKTLRLFNILWVLLVFSAWVLELAAPTTILIAGVVIGLIINIAWKKAASDPELAIQLDSFQKLTTSRRARLFLGFLAFLIGPTLALVNIPFKDWDQYKVLGAFVGLTMSVFFLRQALRQVPTDKQAKPLD